jgi:hypothetical protein
MTLPTPSAAAMAAAREIADMVYEDGGEVPHVIDVAAIIDRHLPRPDATATRYAVRVTPPGGGAYLFALKDDDMPALYLTLRGAISNVSMVGNLYAPEGSDVRVVKRILAVLPGGDEGEEKP